MSDSNDQSTKVGHRVRENFVQKYFRKLNPRFVEIFYSTLSESNPVSYS